MMRSLLIKLKKIFIIRFIIDVMTKFGNNNGPLLAAGLAFFLVIAFVPLLLVGIAILGYFIHRPEDALPKIQHLLTTQILPGAAGEDIKKLIDAANIAETVQKIRDTRSRSGIIGLLGVIWASIQIYLNGATAMNTAWEMRESRGWIKLRLVALGLLASTGVLLVLSIAATAYGSYLNRAIGYLPGQARITTISTELGAMIISTLMYAIIYKYLPSAKVSWKSAIVGGISAAIAWEIAKKGLTNYLLHPNTSLYGNLANVVIFVLWIYYSMMIFLLGAEVAAHYAKEIESRKTAVLKRAANSTPAIDTATGTAKAPSRRQNHSDGARKAGRNNDTSPRRR